MRPVNTRRWPRFHVHLPVSIAAGAGGSSITVPGLVSELSRGGIELNGGVQRRPGDLLESSSVPPNPSKFPGLSATDPATASAWNSSD